LRASAEGCARKVTTNDEGRQYNLGRWHEVTVRRHGINGTLQVTGIAGGILSINQSVSLSLRLFQVETTYNSEGLGRQTETNAQFQQAV